MSIFLWQSLKNISPFYNILGITLNIRFSIFFKFILYLVNFLVIVIFQKLLSKFTRLNTTFLNIDKLFIELPMLFLE